MRLGLRIFIAGFLISLLSALGSTTSVIGDDIARLAFRIGFGIGGVGILVGFLQVSGTQRNKTDSAN